MAYLLLTFAWCSSLRAEGSTRRLRPSPNVARRRARAFWALLAGALSASACYTSPINRAPTVSAINNVGDIWRGQPATFSVEASDLDADPLTIGWAIHDDVCPDARVTATWPQTKVEGPLALRRTFPVGAAPDKAFCVWAFATDTHNAVAAFNQTFTPGNRPPVTVFDLATPEPAVSYPLYTQFSFRGDRSTDPEGDLQTFEWMLTSAPSGFMGGLWACDDMDPPSDAVRCLTADVPGRYVVSLRVDDPEGPEHPDRVGMPQTLTLDVLPDQPPCIKTTMPPFASLWDGDPTQEATFNVAKVGDDGDQQDIHFSWSYARTGEPWKIQNNDFPLLSIPADTFLEGDTAEVRVEIRDKVNQDEIRQALSACGAESLCSTQGLPTCPQRVTWMVKWAL